MKLPEGVPVSIARTIDPFARWETTLGAVMATIAAEVIEGAAMAYREVSIVEIGEVMRRWQAGASQRLIAAGTGLSRVMVRRRARSR